MLAPKLYQSLVLLMVLPLTSCAVEEASPADSSDVGSYRQRVGTTSAQAEEAENNKQLLRKNYEQLYPDLATGPTFSIVDPGAWVNSATFDAMWTIPTDVKDYDVIVSFVPECPIGTMIQTSADHADQKIEVGPLDEGTYYLCVQAIIWGGSHMFAENNSFEFTVDLTPPEAFTIESVPTITSDATPTITWSESNEAHDYSVVVATDDQCAEKVQERAGIAGLEHTFDPLPTGDYYLCVDAVDQALNHTRASNGVLSFTVDLNAPQVTDVSAISEDGVYVEGDEVLLRVTFDENLVVPEDTSGIQLALSTGNLAVYSASADNQLDFSYIVQAGDNVSDLALRDFREGPNLIFGESQLQDTRGVQTPDSFEIVESWLSGKHNIEVDTVPPVTTISSGPDSLHFSTSAIFALTCDDDPCTYEGSLDGVSWQAITSPHTVTGLVDKQTYTYYVRATDNASLLETTPVSSTFTIDLYQPTTTVTSAPASASNTASPSFAFTCSEAQCSFFGRLDGGDWASVTSPHALSGLSEGAHTFEVYSQDAIGRTDATPEVTTWTVDLTAPTATISTSPQSAEASSSATFALGCNESSCSYGYRLDAQAIASVTGSNLSLSGLADGSHQIQFFATDAAGNTQATGTSYSWTVDTTPPETTISSQPASLVASTSASFEFSCNENPCTYQAQIDAGAWSSVTSPHVFSGLSQGSHTVNIRAIDAVSNTDASPASVTWTVDTVAPNTTIDSGPSGSSQNDFATVTFSCDEASCTFEGRLDSGAWSTITSPHALSSLSEAAHTFEVRATDAAGNTDSSPSSSAWEVDNTSPDTSIDSQPGNPTNLSSSTFTFSCDDTPCSFEYSLNSSAWASATTPHVVPAIAGSNTYQVRGVDAALNIDATPASYTWTLDTTDPTAGGGGTLTVTSPSTSSLQIDWTKGTDNHSAVAALQYQAYYSTSNNIGSVADAKANGTAFGSYSADIATTTVTSLTSDVLYYVTVLMRDEAGNESAYTSNSFRVQATPASISNLLAWYDANEISDADNSEMLTVDDRSSNNNDATAPAAGQGPNVVYAQANGRKVLRFDGNDSLGVDAIADELRTASAVTMFLVVKQNTAGNVEYLISTHDDLAPDTEPIKFRYGSACSSNGEVILTADSSNDYTSCESDVTSYLLISMVVNTDGKVYKNGERIINESTINPTFANLDRVLIGAQFDAGYARADFLNGDIAELIVYDRALTDTERHNLESFLAGRFGLTVLQE